MTAAVAMLASAAFAQEQLQYNVPYRCTDGTYKVISQCKPYGRGEMCFWGNYQKNGQLINEQFNVRPQMDGWLRECRPDKPASAPAAGAAAPKAANQASQQPVPSTLVPTPSGRIAAGLNPPYLNNLPSVETVKKLIQGSDPTDTLERQVAVFNELNAIIQHHRIADRSRYDMTPDEGKVTYAYNLAAYQIEEGYKKTHTPAEGQAFFQRHGQYEMDAAIQKEINTKLLSAEAVAENRQNDASAFQQLKAHNDAIVRQNEQANANAEAAQAKAGGLSNDPTAVATRRCLELGGNDLMCVGKSFGKGLMGMIGLDLDALTAAGHTGLTIAGKYQGGGVYLNFGDSTVSLGGCGKLVELGLSYTITRRGTSLVIQTTNQPKPFTVVLGPDGNIAGPGLTDVLGQIIIGYETRTIYTRRVSDNQIVGSRQESVPVYAPKQERCSIAALHSTGAVTTGKMDELLPALFAVATGNSKADITTYPAGPRMAGNYEGSGGLKIQFEPEGAILDCREAHVARRYTVQNAADALRVSIDNGGTPITLTLQPDGSLTGTGSADIAGRLVTGTTPDGVAFRPTRAACPVGTLTPRSQRSGTNSAM